MKWILIFFFSFISVVNGKEQFLSSDILQSKINAHRNDDTIRVNFLNDLAKHNDIDPGLRDSSIEEALTISEKINFKKGSAIALSLKSQYSDKSNALEYAKRSISLAEASGDRTATFWSYRALGQAMLYTSESVNSIQQFEKALTIAEQSNDPRLIVAGQLAFVDYYKNVRVIYPLALEWALKAFRTVDKYRDTLDLPIVYRNIGLVYLMIGENEKSIGYLQNALRVSRRIGDKETEQYALNDIGEIYRLTGKYQEALNYYKEAALIIKDPFNIELNESNVADTYQRMGNDSMCFVFSFRALKSAEQLKDTIGMAWINNILSRAFLHSGKTNKSIYHGLKGYQFSVQAQTLEFQRDNSEALSNAYTKSKNFQEANYFYKIFIASRDSMLNNEIANKTNLAQYNYDLQNKQAEISVLNKDKQLQEVMVQRQRFILAGTIAVLIVIITSLIILYRNNSKRKIANALLKEQNIEIEKQRDQTDRALKDLKQAQKQLIHSEKMASLGELTAGIAHEIQNPLNFVNNFSELSKDLLNEMKAELQNGNAEAATELAENTIENLEKISHHGKRAEGIVRGMLQHSRTNNDKLELTDINELADEYLRLSYHGLRAKDNSFNATLRTDYDKSISKINIVAQDIGRVILNLLTNAFYSVNEKKQKLSSNNQGENYEPTVTITTTKTDHNIILKIKDNGTGIPEKVMEKIFQPFFTTKPPGQGTGLGLSLSYDIVTKLHGGQLKVDTSENEGSEFIIELPL